MNAPDTLQFARIYGKPVVGLEWRKVQMGADECRKWTADTLESGVWDSKIGFMVQDVMNEYKLNDISAAIAHIRKVVS